LVWFEFGCSIGRIAKLTRVFQGASELAPRDGDSGAARRQSAKAPNNIPATFNNVSQTSHPADNRYDHDPKFSPSNFFSPTKRYLRILNHQQYNCLSGRAARKSAPARGNEKPGQQTDINSTGRHRATTQTILYCSKTILTTFSKLTTMNLRP
jgi:hypothetical protein